ncbi:OprD family outer membrane porin [Pseudomonas putida]|nr:OprD family outer membrane porin [Pseudomonas putida]
MLKLNVFHNGPFVRPEQQRVARVSKSVLKMGTLLPRYPVLGYSDSRMVPQTFRGSALTFQEVA